MKGDRKEKTESPKSSRLDGIEREKEAQAALQEGEARLESIFRAAPVGIGVSVDRVITEVNDRLCEMTGYGRNELIGSGSRMLYPTREDFDYVGDEKYRQIAQTGTGIVETRCRRKDGEIIEVLLSSSQIDPADPSKGLTFTALDITARKRAGQRGRHLRSGNNQEKRGALAG